MSKTIQKTIFFFVLFSIFTVHSWTEQARAETHYYRVMVKTSDIADAGTDADVTITVYGINGTASFDLDTADYDDFERNDNDNYQVSCEQDLGTIYAVKLEHDDSGAAAGWHVEKVSVFYEGTNNEPNKLTVERIIDPNGMKEYLEHSRVKEFALNRWLASDEGDRRTEVTIGKLSKEMIESPENFSRERAGLHKARLLTPQESGTSWAISQTAVDEISISRARTTSTESTTKIGLKSTTEGQYAGLKQTLELSAEVSNTVASEIQSAISKSKSLATTISDTTVFTVPENKVMGVVYWKYESRANGKLRVEDIELEFTAVEHSWIEPETMLFDPGSDELREFKKRYDIN